MTGLKAAVSFAMTSSEDGTPKIQRGMGVMPVEELQSPSGNIAPTKAPWFPFVSWRYKE